jgi:hypothetical protein
LRPLREAPPYDGATTTRTVPSSAVAFHSLVVDHDADFTSSAVSAMARAFASVSRFGRSSMVRSLPPGFARGQSSMTAQMRRPSGPCPSRTR